MLRKLLPVAMLGLLGACAFGNTIDYQGQSLSLAAKSGKSVAVGVDDKRPTVVSGDNTPEWVGVTRSGIGIPYGVHTTSGKPLAVDFATSIVAALKKNGVNATAITLPVSADGVQAVKLLEATKAERTLLVTMKQWKTDKYFDSSLDYDLYAEVRDAAGNLLASNNVGDSKTVGGAFTLAAEKGSVAGAEDALKKLLDDQKLIDALK